MHLFNHIFGHIRIYTLLIIYIYSYMHIYIYTYVHVLIYMYIYIHVFSWLSVYSFIDLQIVIGKHLHTFEHMPTFIFTSICMSIS